MNPTDEVMAKHYNAEIEVKATPNPATNRIDLYFIENYPHDRLVAENIRWKQTLYNEWVEPLLSLTGKNAQQLMNQLWACGIRPTQIKKNDIELAATLQRNLKWPYD